MLASFLDKQNSSYDHMKSDKQLEYSLTGEKDLKELKIIVRLFCILRISFIDKVCTPRLELIVRYFVTLFHGPVSVISTAVSMAIQHF